ADQEGSPATEVLVNGGTVQDVRETGAPTGTLIEVRDLFFNVPARRKFMRSHETELTHVRSTFIIQALSCPGIGMSLTVDGREMYRLAPGERTDRIRELFGPEFMEKMMPVSFDSGALTVSGFVSR
ncbi:MAG: DNA mismatch repair protein MutL, partial [Nitrospinaceae bacterium]|nr:DNA mismatch repair protein MutL [Nitrospinaceae bacterium]